MIEEYTGELAALGTAFCWATSALFFEAAGRKVGSLAVNLIRLVIGLIMLSLFTWAVRGILIPLDFPARSWFWLTISGLIGFSIGDLCLFQAHVEIGSRTSMLIMSMVPVFTSIIGWQLMDEILAPVEILGIFITILGIAVVVLERDRGGVKSRSKHSPTGVLLGLGGAVGQAVGLVLSKYGMRDYSPFAATQIRIIAGIAGFSLIFTLTRRWRGVITTLGKGRAMFPISMGAMLGPFIGVSLSLMAIQYIPTGVASTFMATVPVIIIPFAVVFMRERVTLREIAGAIVTVAGVAILFLV